MNKRELSEQLQEDFLAYLDGLEDVLDMDEICQMIVDRIEPSNPRSQEPN